MPRSATNRSGSRTIRWASPGSRRKSCASGMAWRSSCARRKPRSRCASSRAQMRSFLSTLLAARERERRHEMSNLLIRREPAGGMAARKEFDPLGFMADFMRFDPFRELEPAWWYDDKIAFRPAFEVKETKDAFSFIADMPGIVEKD